MQRQGSSLTRALALPRRRRRVFLWLVTTLTSCYSAQLAAYIVAQGLTELYRVQSQAALSHSRPASASAEDKMRSNAPREATQQGKAMLTIE